MTIESIVTVCDLSPLTLKLPGLPHPAFELADRVEPHRPVIDVTDTVASRAITTT